MSSPELSVILPCRNEEAALGSCLTIIQEVLRDMPLTSEIIVSDSSTDRSTQIARAHGVQVIPHGKLGYGVALQEGFARARGKYLLCADADMTYDFTAIASFIDKLRTGADLAIGIRDRRSGVSPWLHAYVGVPITALVIQLLFGGTIKDPHCGIRAITRDAYDQLGLQTTGMEFASEMIVRALQAQLRIAQLPTPYYTRQGQSKLQTWPDGWRHLKLLTRLRFEG